MKQSFIIISFVLACFGACHGSQGNLYRGHDERFPNFMDGVAERFQERFDRSQIDRIINELPLEQGMTVVDIGTGTGLYAYVFAEHLDGTGKVYATDIDEGMIAWVEEEKERRGLKNLIPKKVSASGVDPFYTDHSFDVIFMSHVFFHLKDLGDYFKTLRKSLSKGGKLIIVQDRGFNYFKHDDITDIAGLRRALIASQIDDRFLSYFDTITADSPASDVCDALNAVLRDSDFFRGFTEKNGAFDQTVAFTAEEKSFAQYVLGLLKRLDMRGELRKDEKLYPNAVGVVKMMNKLLIIQHFRDFLYNGNQAPYLPGCQENIASGTHYDTIVRTLDVAGYYLERLDCSVPFVGYLVFMKKDEE
jgi:SAM-dependent methyltransferase